MTRRSNQPVFEARHANHDEGAILESWYQTEAWIKAASDPQNIYWSDTERVSLSVHQRVDQHPSLVALEEV